MKKFVVAAAFIATLSPVAAFAGEECTAETMQAKAMEVSTKLQEMAATDPQKVAEITPKIQEAATRFQDGSNLEEACAFYDELLAEMAPAE